MGLKRKWKDLVNEKTVTGRGGGFGGGGGGVGQGSPWHWGSGQPWREWAGGQRH